MALDYRTGKWETSEVQNLLLTGKSALVWSDGEKEVAEPPLCSDSWLFAEADSSEIVSQKIWRSVLCAGWLVLSSLQVLHEQPREVLNLCNLK